jgi:hypothetical protein
MDAATAVATTQKAVETAKSTPVWLLGGALLSVLAVVLWPPFLRCYRLP